MPKDTDPLAAVRTDLAIEYAKFRSGKKFLLALACVVFGWLIWNLCPWVPHFDDAGFERLNLFLSIESSMTVSLLLMWQERQEAVERARMEQMLLVMQSVRDMMEAQHEILIKLRDLP